MRSLWVGKCHLRARNFERERWIGNSSEAIGELVMRSGSEEMFSSDLISALNMLGYDVVQLHDIRRAEELPRGGTTWERLRELTAKASFDRPVPIGGFVPISDFPQWSETDWHELLNDHIPVWAVVDGVAWPEVSAMLAQSNEPHRCLYSTPDADRRSLAPWVMRVRPGGVIARELKARRALSHSYILLKSHWELDRIRGHLRHFTMTRVPTDPDTPVYFRFYDPRVLVDMFAGLRSETLARFMQPFPFAAVQASPLTLLSSGSLLNDGAVTAFSAEEACHGRLFQISAPTTPPSADRTHISQPEFEAMSKLMSQRAALKLARRLYLDHAAQSTQEDCHHAALLAPSKAASFGLTTVKQVAIVARAILLFGDDFEKRHLEAAHILTDGTLRPWQKKDRLSDWFVKAWAQSFTPRMD